MLNQAFYHTLADDRFKMIVLHEGNLGKLKKLPEYLKSVIRCPCLSVKIPTNIIFIEIPFATLTNQIKLNVTSINQIKYELRDLDVTYLQLQYITRFSELSEAVENDAQSELRDDTYLEPEHANAQQNETNQQEEANNAGDLHAAPQSSSN